MHIKLLLLTRKKTSALLWARIETINICHNTSNTQFIESKHEKMKLGKEIVNSTLWFSLCDWTSGFCLRYNGCHGHERYAWLGPLFVVVSRGYSQVIWVFKPYMAFRYRALTPNIAFKSGLDSIWTNSLDKLHIRQALSSHGKWISMLSWWNRRSNEFFFSYTWLLGCKVATCTNVVQLDTKQDVHTRSSYQQFVRCQHKLIKWNKQFESKVESILKCFFFKLHSIQD